MQVHRIKEGASTLAVIAAVAAVILVPAWISKARSETINVAWTGEYWSTLPVKVAADKGFFERRIASQVDYHTFSSHLSRPNAGRS